MPRMPPGACLAMIEIEFNASGQSMPWPSNRRMQAMNQAGTWTYFLAAFHLRYCSVHSDMVLHRHVTTAPNLRKNNGYIYHVTERSIARAFAQTGQPHSRESCSLILVGIYFSIMHASHGHAPIVLISQRVEAIVTFPHGLTMVVLCIAEGPTM